MFDLEKSIRDWLKNLRKIQSFEDGYIVELESHLRDEIDRLIKAGLGDEDAFRKTVAMVGTAESIGLEYYKINARPLAALPSWQTSRFSPALIWNYIKTAIRKARRQKAYSFINVAGLAVGMAGAILILLWVQNETSFDRFHEKADRTYRLDKYLKMGGTENRDADSTGYMASLLRREFPEIAETVRFRAEPRRRVTFGDKVYYENRVWYADASLFDIFTFPLISGDPGTALQAPYSALVTEDIAKKYFGRENPLGKSIKLEDGDLFAITGVLKNLPSNSHLVFDLLLSFSTLEAKSKTSPVIRGMLNNPLDFNFITYVLLKPGTNPADLEQKFPGLILKSGAGSLKGLGTTLQMFLRPLKDVHLRGTSQSPLIIYVTIFSAVALFILLIAVTNYVNLATARSSNRAREVGIRKAIGAEQRKLVFQFLMESFLWSFLAAGLAVILVVAALPVLNSLSQSAIAITPEKAVWLIPLVVGLALFVGLSAGIYPAVFLSAFQPVKVLKSPARSGIKGSRIRSLLVITQFSVSITLIAGTAVIIRQLDYMKKKSPGFAKDQVVVLPAEETNVWKSFRSLKDELKRCPDVLSVGASSILPGETPQNNQHRPEGFLQSQMQLMDDLNVDEDFLETLGIEIKTGRNFSSAMSTDAHGAVIINETAAKRYGWENPVGKTFSEYNRKRTVIAVVKDFHLRPISQMIEPLYLFCDPDYPYNPYRLFLIKIRAGDISGTLAALKKTWTEFAPGRPFEFSFLDETFDRQFKNVESVRDLLSFFTGMAIFIACLGLFGLASFMAEQRTKEIGIRKVMGASASEIIRLLSKEFAKAILAANLIAWPVTYLVMRGWIQHFAYRTGIGFGIFVSSGALALAVALLTVSYQSIKAALANPVESLRYE